MARGTIENKGAGQINIRKLGWLIPGLATVDIPDEIKYAAVKNAEKELKALITAETVELKNAGAAVVASDDIDTWIADEWEVGPGTSGQGVNQLTIDVVLKGRVTGGSGIVALGGEIPHTEVGFIVSKNSILKSMSIVINVEEDSETYDLRIYSDPTGSPTVFISGKLSITPSAGRQFTVTGLSDSLPAGEYGLFLYKTAGGTGSSKFRKGRVVLVIEEASA
jgi:hypothetical protein